MNPYIEHIREMRGTGHSEEAVLTAVTKDAEGGNVSAMEVLCDSYYYGNIGIKDYELALFWGERARQNGSIRAKEILGIMYLYGYAAEADESKALGLLKEAVEGGCMKAGRYIGLSCLNHGNSEEAFSWFLKAAERGDVTSQHHLGNCYENGVGCEQSMEKALYWYRLAARRKDHVGQPAIDALKRLGADIP